MMTPPAQRLHQGSDQVAKAGVLSPGGVAAGPVHALNAGHARDRAAARPLRDNLL